MDSRVDLHVHSTASDGTLTPSELVAHAAEAGLAALALTDHDTTAGCAEAIAAGTAQGIEVVPGIEISARRERGTLHIVGLFINPDDAQLQMRCAQMRAERARRNERIVAQLNDLGVEVTLEDVAAKCRGDVMGRPHIAALLIERGHVATSEEAFDRYLAKGRPAYFPKAVFDPAESIALIHDAGGVAVLAHPSLLNCESEEAFSAAVAELAAHGLDAIETQWSTATDEEMQMAKRIAERHGLLHSGGSDFHGGPKPNVQIGCGPGHLCVTAETLDKLREVARARR